MRVYIAILQCIIVEDDQKIALIVNTIITTCRPFLTLFCYSVRRASYTSTQISIYYYYYYMHAYMYIFFQRFALCTKVCYLVSCSNIQYIYIYTVQSVCHRRTVPLTAAVSLYILSSLPRGLGACDIIWLAFARAPVACSNDANKLNYS